MFHVKQRCGKSPTQYSLPIQHPKTHVMSKNTIYKPINTFQSFRVIHLKDWEYYFINHNGDSIFFCSDDVRNVHNRCFVLNGIDIYELYVVDLDGMYAVLYNENQFYLPAVENKDSTLKNVHMILTVLMFLVCSFGAITLPTNSLLFPVCILGTIITLCQILKKL